MSNKGAISSVPNFYPAASRVVSSGVIAQKHVEENIELLRKLPKFVDIFSGRTKTKDNYVKQASENLNFELDVICERGLSSLTYKQAQETLRAYHAKLNLTKKKTKLRPEGGRINPEGDVQKHANCHARIAQDISNVRTKTQHEVENARKHFRRIAVLKRLQGKQPLDIKDQVQIVRQMQGKPQMEWDEYLLGSLNRNTACWILSQAETSQSQNYERLRNYVDSTVGFAECSDIMFDNISNEESKDQSSLISIQKFDSRFPNTRDATFTSLEQSDESLLKAAYYKKRRQCEDEKLNRFLEKMDNSTASIDVEAFRVRTFPKRAAQNLENLNGKLGQEHVSGTKIETASGANEFKNSFLKRKSEVYKNRRWVELPKPKQDPAEVVLERSTFDELNDKFEKLYITLDDDGQHRQLIVHKWLAANNVGHLWYHATPKEIEVALSSINDSEVFDALATCARAAVFRLPKLAEYSFFEETVDVADDAPLVFEEKGKLPGDLRLHVEKYLKNHSQTLQMAAAVTLLILNEKNDEAISILTSRLTSNQLDDRLIAALVLTYTGLCNSFIVEVFIQVLLTTSVDDNFKLSLEALIKLSNGNKVVHYMVGEFLNSKNWKERFMACKIIPRLNGPVSKDVGSKLLRLMWHDWAEEARTAAAQAIGQLRLGNLVFEKIKDLLNNGNDIQRVDALKKLVALNYYTPRLLQSLLDCLSSDYITVRMETCVACAHLGIKDQEIIDQLLNLTKFDPSWKVIVKSINALGHLKIQRTDVKEAIVWSFRYGDIAEVRSAAVGAISDLKMSGAKIIKDLQERLLVETDEEVTSKIKHALINLGEDPSGDMEMVEKIKSEVKRLCTTHNIARKILIYEQDVSEREKHSTLLCLQPKVRRKYTSPIVSDHTHSVFKKLDPPEEDNDDVFELNADFDTDSSYTEESIQPSPEPLPQEEVKKEADPSVPLPPPKPNFVRRFGRPLNEMTPSPTEKPIEKKSPTPEPQKSPAEPEITSGSDSPMLEDKPETKTVKFLDDSEEESSSDSESAISAT